MGEIAVNNILKIEVLSNEFEFEKASSMYLKLRKNENRIDERAHLKKLIQGYESKFWANEDKVSSSQIAENDYAEKLVRLENSFISKRKELIKAKLKEFGFSQSDLANILGHRKGYMSELINGLRPFSKEDIVVLNKLLGLKFEILVPPFIKQDRAERINNALELISNAKRLRKSKRIKISVV